MISDAKEARRAVSDRKKSNQREVKPKNLSIKQALDFQTNDSLTLSFYFMHWNVELKNSCNKIIFFDSDCLLCLWSVRFVLRHDKIGDIFFAGIQSDFARENLTYDQIDFEYPASIIYSKESHLFFKSDAVFEISKNFGFILRAVAIFRVIPKPIRDWLYDWIASNRYRIFGKPTSCYIPAESISHRFL